MVSDSISVLNTNKLLDLTTVLHSRFKNMGQTNWFSNWQDDYTDEDLEGTGQRTVSNQNLIAYSPYYPNLH